MGQNARRRVIADDLVSHARSIADRHRFFHWEIGFPNVWSDLLSAEPTGGFDAVIGNPPYVRQELLAEIKPALKKAYRTFDGVADLYIYFYEQGLRLLRPGGRMSYVVTNKWLKAGYAENLREMFTDPARAELEFVADFGHAKHFFPDADVFPSVVVMRKPSLDVPATDTGTAQICVIPRDLVPQKGLSAAVAEASYPLPLAVFSKESWTLEPPNVMALLAKIKRNGIPLTEYTAVKPYRGVLTGFNEAFLIDDATRQQLVRDDPNCSEIIKPYLRGQDIKRWVSSWDGLWMIFCRRGIDIAQFPSVLRHLKAYRPQLEPKPSNWRPAVEGQEWGGRKEGHYKWYEIQDSVDYFHEFEKPKIVYQEIQYAPLFAFDESGFFGNNKTFLIATRDDYLLATLNSPLMWWHNWRYLPHMKDEALTPIGIKMEALPIAAVSEVIHEKVRTAVNKISVLISARKSGNQNIIDWLQVEFGVAKTSRLLVAPDRLDSDGFIAAVRSALPKRQKLSSTDLARLRLEWKNNVSPVSAAHDEIIALERQLSDVVNAAYSLTPEELKLMWETAPPRMPLDPAEELRRLE